MSFWDPSKTYLDEGRKEGIKKRGIISESSTIEKNTLENQFEEESFFWLMAHWFKGFNPWLAASIAWGDIDRYGAEAEESAYLVEARKERDNEWGKRRKGRRCKKYIYSPQGYTSRTCSLQLGSTPLKLLSPSTRPTIKLWTLQRINPSWQPSL